MKSQFTKRNLIWTIVVCVIFSIFQIAISGRMIPNTYQVAIITIGINIILALGLNLIIGFTGQFSLGHAGFMSIGAYSAAIVLAKMPNLTGLFVGMLVGMAITAVVALIVAIPTLRLRGDYLAIATLGFSEVIRIAIQNMEITGGAAGLSNIPKLTTFPLVFVFIVISVIVIHNFIRSSHGRACISAREDEIASESMGINTTKYKTLAFVIGAMLASIAGALYAAYFYVLKPTTFGFMKSIDILVIVVFGGMGSLSGSILAAIVLGIINLTLQSYSEIRMILYALAIIVIMVYRPQGLFGSKEVTDFLPKKWQKKKEVD